MIAEHVLVMWLLLLPVLFTLNWREQISSFSSWLPHSNFKRNQRPWSVLMLIYWSLTTWLRYSTYEGTRITRCGQWCEVSVQHVCVILHLNTSKVSWLISGRSTCLCLANHQCTYLSQNRLWIRGFLISTDFEHSCVHIFIYWYFTKLISMWGFFMSVVQIVFRWVVV